jgi:hypothetical protein
MMRYGYRLGAGFAILTLGLWCAAKVGGAPATAVRDDVLKLAQEIEKSGRNGSQSLADDLAKKHPLEDVMDLMKLRRLKGLGVGPSASGKPDDGIEAKLINLTKHAPKAKELQSEAKDWEQSAYVMAAIAELAERQCPVKSKEGKKDPNNWNKWSKDMEVGALDLASALRGKKPKEVQRAAQKLNTTCNACHTDFRD